MEKVTLQLKYKTLRKALATIDKAINILKEIDENSELGKLALEGLIQRFEVSCDQFWKYLKEYLLVVKGIQQKSPKSIFQECWEQKTISTAELQLFIDMVDDRNTTTYTYSEEDIELIVKDILVYAPLMNLIIERTKADWA
jgi:nucleotidyltransferase substrate binding protein (TIGR01987 family)